MLHAVAFIASFPRTMKRVRFCPDANLPVPKWPRLQDPWSEKDLAEAHMVNSLHIPAPERWWAKSLERSRKRSPDSEIIHTYWFKTGVYTSQNGISWSKLVEALDLAYFDEDILHLPGVADAWRPLPAIVQLWFVVRNLPNIELGNDTYVHT